MVEPAGLQSVRPARRARSVMDLSQSRHRQLAFALLSLNRVTIPFDRLLGLLPLEAAVLEQGLSELARMGVLRLLPRFRTHCFQLIDPAALLQAYVDIERQRPRDWLVRYFRWPEEEGRGLLRRVAETLDMAQVAHACTGVPVYDYVAPTRRVPTPVCFHVTPSPEFEYIVRRHERPADESSLANVVMLIDACPFGLDASVRQFDGIRFATSFQTYLDAHCGRLPLDLDPEDFRWAHLAY